MTPVTARGRTGSTPSVVAGCEIAGRHSGRDVLGYAAARRYALYLVRVSGQDRRDQEGPMNCNLTDLSRLDIEDKREGLSEPSGLAPAQGHDGFWTVSDDTGTVFKLDREGRVGRSRSPGKLRS